MFGGILKNNNDRQKNKYYEKRFFLRIERKYFDFKIKT